MKILILLALTIATNVFANTNTESDFNLDDVEIPDEAIENPRFTIEGNYKVEEPVTIKPERLVFEERRLSAAEKLRQERLKLEEQNRLMMERQIENIRIQQEIELSKKLEHAMNAAMKAFEQL